MIGYIYAHLTPSGKYYIGQTTRKLKSRWGKNGIGYKGDTIFWNAINKYGWDNIKHIILEKIEADNELELYNKLNELELYYIEKYNAMAPYGYNIRGGGNGPLAEETKQKISDKLSGKPKSDEHKKHLSEAAHLRRDTEETRQNKSQALKGKKAWNKGLTKETSIILKNKSDRMRQKYDSGELVGYWKNKTFSEEYRKKLSDAHKGKKLSNDTRKKMSESKKGIKKSESMKKKLSESRKGMKLSDETKKKLSESHKGKAKGKIYINDGINMKMVFEKDYIEIYQPLGWVKGYLKNGRKRNKNDS